MKLFLLLILSTNAEIIHLDKNKTTVEDLKKYKCVKYVDRQNNVAFYGDCDIITMIKLSTFQKWINNIDLKDAL